jgi:CDP-4-dehydro-6-deoxyglucose reductase, E1
LGDPLTGKGERCGSGPDGSRPSRLRKRESLTGAIVELGFPGAVPVSGIAGYALVISEPNPDGEVRLLPIYGQRSGNAAEMLELPEGTLPQASFLSLEKQLEFHVGIIRRKIKTVPADLLESVMKRLVGQQVKRYFEAVHKPGLDRGFVPMEDPVHYGGRVFDEEELICLMDASLDFFLTAGRHDREFCSRLSDYLQPAGITPLHVLSCNSGSSANLIALSALTSPRLGASALKPGDEVITVAAGFPTSVTPIIQNRLVPVFVDIEVGSYNIDAGKLEAAISEKTRAILLAHTLGIPFDLDRVLGLAERYGLWLVEDNCDALGTKYRLAREYTLIRGKTVSGEAKTGTFGHFGTSSFYPSHHITTGEGGALYTTDRDLFRIALSMRDWGRDCWCEPGQDNTCSRRFDRQFGRLPAGYDHKYTYSHLGYNLKMTDLQSAIGVAQLKKIEAFNRKRVENWNDLRNGVSDLENKLQLPFYPPQAGISPFGFALAVRPDAGFSRDELIRFLERHNIQTRPLFAGNLLRHPAFTDAGIYLRIIDSGLLRSDALKEEDFRLLSATEETLHRAFWIGVYPGLKPGMLDFMIEKIHEFCTKGPGLTRC